MNAATNSAASANFVLKDVHIQISAASAELLIAELSKFGLSVAAVGNGTPPAPSPAPTAAPAATSAPAASTASSTKPGESPAGKGEATALDYLTDVKPLVLKVGAAGKRDNLVELLKKFGAKQGPEVAADKLPAFKAELEALLA